MMKEGNNKWLEEKKTDGVSKLFQKYVLFSVQSTQVNTWSYIIYIHVDYMYIHTDIYLHFPYSYTLG